MTKKITILSLLSTVLILCSGCSQNLAFGSQIPDELKLKVDKSRILESKNFKDANDNKDKVKYFYISEEVAEKETLYGFEEDIEKRTPNRTFFDNGRIVRLQLGRTYHKDKDGKWKFVKMGITTKEAYEEQTSLTTFESVRNFLFHDVYAQEADTLSPSDDAVIYEDNGDTNYGSTEFLLAEHTGVVQRSSLMQFDFSGLPPLTLTSATLNLELTASASFNHTVLFNRVSESWAEGTVTWNNQPSAKTQFTTHFVPDGATGERQIDITTQVGNWIDGTDTNYGFLMGNTTTESSSQYGSQENATTADRPTLDLVYELFCAPTAGQEWQASYNDECHITTDTFHDAGLVCSGSGNFVVDGATLRVASSTCDVHVKDDGVFIIGSQ